MNKFKENKIFELVKLLLATIPKVNFSIVGTANKQDDSVVTNVDYEVNSIVISKIKYLFGKEVPIISEEIENDKDYINSCLHSDLCFVIDPIDGTMALCVGLNTCTISIGIMKHGIITDGIIYLIDKNEVIFTDGGDVFVFNSELSKPELFKKVKISFKDGLQPVSIASSLARNGYNVRKPLFVINASVFSMYNTFKGIFEKSICRTKLWDICACLAIGERLGCNFYRSDNMKKITCTNILDFIELENERHILSVGDLNIITYS